MICLKEDDYTRNRFLSNTRWEALLSDGSVCIEDNDRPEYKERSAWLRLKEYLKETNLKINNIIVRFRDNIITPVPPNAPAYMIRDGAFSLFMKQETKKLLIIGFLHPEEQKVHTQVFFVPELRRLYSEWRDPNDEKQIGESLIYNGQ